MTSFGSLADRQQDVVWLWSRRHHHGILSSTEGGTKHSTSTRRIQQLTHEVTSLHKVLKRLQAETTNPESWLYRIQDGEKQDLESIVNSCSHVLQGLDTILEKYSTLKEVSR
jgi:hypothetical protein